MTQLKVLQLIDGLNMGGAEILLCDLVRHLRDEGYPISVGYSTPGPLAERLQALQVPLTRLPRRARIDPTLYQGMVQLIRREKPDLVHTHLFKSDLHGRLAARRCGVPLVVSTCHNNDSWARNKVFGWLYGRTNLLADRVIAVSEEVRDYQVAHTFTPAEKFTVINSGVDISRFTGQEEAGAAVRAELGIEPSVPLVGIIGRLTPQKGHVTFLQAAGLINKTLPEARFLVVGDGPLRDELQAQAHSLGLEGTLSFCGLRQDIPAVLKALDLLVFSSQWEGLPITLLEGMAAARPVVSTKVGGVAGVARDNETALLVPPADPEALAAACLRFLRNPDMRDRFGKAGHMRVREHYSLEAMLRNTTALYEELWRAHG
jgi:glycosyltransferase involved in cell wall biosynthesis